MNRLSRLVVTCISLAAFMLMLHAPATQAQNLPSPDDYLGYELGSHFTPHHQVLGYVKTVAEQSPLVQYQSYGTTNEGRELGVVFVSSEENIARREELRTTNMQRTGLMQGEPAGAPVPIVWLSYNVHGDESSSSEAAMKTLYELVRPDRADTKAWLNKTLVVIDPMLNPDGRDRYVHWYNETAGDTPNVHPGAREHDQPWPGGRTNHYYFDLNRDWAWLTQQESRARVAFYNRWMPQIHVDFHEQGINSPYYFAPGAKPYHEAITPWQVDFQYIIGQNNAAYFDANNWLYFTREVFDLFYPGYGDTYPLFNGAIGMTYEQAGGGGAGLGIMTADGDTLTLRDRLLHHYTTGLSTIETAAEYSDKLVDAFEKYYQSARENPAGRYKSFIIKNDSSAKLQALLNLLDSHQISYEQLGEGGSYSGFSYQRGKEGDMRFNEDAILISAYQPKSTLARVLFEPQPALEDSLTYDITAWALPYAYGLDALATEKRLRGEPYEALESEAATNYSPSATAYITDWNSVSDAAFLSDLLSQGIQVRRNSEALTVNGTNFKPGALIITRAVNENKFAGEALDEVIRAAAERHHQQVEPIKKSFVRAPAVRQRMAENERAPMFDGSVTAGPNLGSSQITLQQQPRVGLLSGPSTNAGEVGEVWHLFDRQLQYPLTIFSADDGNWPLNGLDVLVMPSGNYGLLLSDEQLGQLREWITAGGRLIALSEANRFLAGQQGFGLKTKAAVADTSSSVATQQTAYGQRQRQAAQEANPGSIFNVTLDTTHPLAYGYEQTYASLKRSTTAYAFLTDGWNVGITDEGSWRSGFVGQTLKRQLQPSLAFGVEPLGRGSVVYMIDNPLFRAFWQNGKLLFSNAVFGSF